MSEPDLFTEAGAQRAASLAPLAVRMRPRTLDEVVGQQHLLRPGSPLRRLVQGDAPLSVVLWGPPGTGKTTIAHLISGTTGRRFVELSAVTAGVKDVRAAIDAARDRLGTSGEQTVLFVDEVHRFSKAQQDALLPAVEQRTVSLVAATTENPSFSVNAPLLSRSLLLTLTPLTADEVRVLVRRALTDPRGYAGTLALAPDAEEHLVRLAGGDARAALTALEAAAGMIQAAGGRCVDLTTVEQAVDRAAVRYDRDGDQHYDVVSAFIKSMRGSDADATLHYLARMLEAGEDPRFVVRRMIVLASEDVGLADPTALSVAVAAAQALERVGLPEARLALAQAALHLALAPKSNAVIAAYELAAADVRAGLAGPVPVHLRDKHYPGARRLGHGVGYRYPHDEPAGVLRQQYPPDEVADRRYYRPSGHGAEVEFGRRHEALRRIITGQPGPAAAPAEASLGPGAAPAYRPPCTPVPVPDPADSGALARRDGASSDSAHPGSATVDVPGTSSGQPDVPATG